MTAFVGMPPPLSLTEMLASVTVIAISGATPARLGRVERVVDKLLQDHFRPQLGACPICTASFFGRAKSARRLVTNCLRVRTLPTLVGCFASAVRFLPVDDLIAGAFMTRLLFDGVSRTLGFQRGRFPKRKTIGRALARLIVWRNRIGATKVTRSYSL